MLTRLRAFAGAAFLAALAACSPTVQTTSGADYLSRGAVTDPAIRAAAAVEPRLRFPARIGIARVVNGRITTAPPSETRELAAFVQRHAAMGDWVPLSPLVAGMVGADRSVPVIDRLRRTAARQHLDYLLVYELGARGGVNGDTPFALADVTVIGGLLLPTRTTRAQGVGSAAFIDVRNGYPYGTTGASTDLSGLARSWSGDRAAERLRQRATAQVAEELLPEVDEMLRLIRARAR